MQTAAVLIELGRKARNDGRTEEACDLYAKAAETSREEGDLVRWAHSLRHYADLQLGLGGIEEARRSIEEVTAFYRKNGTNVLEMGNTLRIAALVEEADGQRDASRKLWTETLTCYEKAGVQAGIDECHKRLS